MLWAVSGVLSYGTTFVIERDEGEGTFGSMQQHAVAQRERHLAEVVRDR